MNQNQIDRMFTTEVLPDESLATAYDLEQEFRGLAGRLDDLLPASREKSLMVTKLQEAFSWAIEAVANDPRWPEPEITVETDS